eukprot:Gb_10892 [translate_table: standard]
MGNHVSCIARDIPRTEYIRLIHSNGSARIYEKALSAGELMAEFPQHLVCDADFFYIGHKIPSLSPEDELKMGHKYFLLPEQSFPSVLSVVSLVSLISPPRPSSSVVHNMKSFNVGRPSVLSSRQIPFDIHKGVDGSLRIKVCAEFISKLIEDGRFNDTKFGFKTTSNNSQINDKYGLICNTPELQKDYVQLVTPRNQPWRPKLDTITERETVAGSSKRFKINRRQKSI